MSTGFQGFRSEMDQNARTAGFLNNQMKALSTTFRYALAGSILFTVPQMVRNLADFEQKLGLIAAIGSQPGGLPLIGSQVDALGQSIQNASVQSITPVNDFADAVANLYSTIQDVPPDTAVEMVSAIAQSAQLAQVSVTDATQAYLQMNYAFRQNQNLGTVQRQAREFFALTRTAPGGIAAGPQIIQQLGPLARVSAFAGMTQEQMMALTIQSLRGGGTPATNLRGLQFLIQSLAQPQTKEAKDTLASIGITPETIQTMPGKGFGALLRIMQHARGLGVTGGGRAGRIDPDELAIDPNDPAQASSALGLSGEGSQFLAKAFHRIHALRTIVGLIVRGEPELRDSLNLIDKAKRDELDDVDSLARAWQDYRERAQLKQVPIALNALGIQTAEIFKPIIGLAARGVIGAQNLAGHHQEEFQYGVLSAVGLAGLATVFRKTRGLSGGLGIFGKLGKGVLGADIAANVISGAPANGTLEHPFFVVPIGGGLTGRGIPGGGKAGDALKRGARRLPLPLGGIGLLGGALAEAGILLSTPGSEGPRNRGKRYPLSDPNFVGAHPLFNRMAYMAGHQLDDPSWRRGHPRITRVADQYRQHQISADDVERRLKRIRQSNIESGRLHITVAGPDGGQPKVDVNVQTDKHTMVDGKRKKRVEVPLDLFPDFGPSQHRGKPRSSRG